MSRLASVMVGLALTIGLTVPVASSAADPNAANDITRSNAPAQQRLSAELHSAFAPIATQFGQLTTQRSIQWLPQAAISQDTQSSPPANEWIQILAGFGLIIFTALRRSAVM